MLTFHFVKLERWSALTHKIIKMWTMSMESVLSFKEEFKWMSVSRDIVLSKWTSNSDLLLNIPYFCHAGPRINNSVKPSVNALFNPKFWSLPVCKGLLFCITNLGIHSLSEQVMHACILSELGVFQWTIQHCYCLHKEREERGIPIHFYFSCHS